MFTKKLDVKMENHMCPVWIGHLLASPLRKLFQSPTKILKPYIKEGNTVLDFGSAMGFFSIPMSKMVGANGRVVCVDVQQKMLDSLYQKAHRAHVASRITLQAGNADILAKFESNFDFALAFAVVHEVPDQDNLLKGLYCSLKGGGRLLIAEPKGHVSQEAFAQTVIAAKNAGFAVVENPVIHKSWTGLLEKSA
jgi:ubiquinone/menaquinone biosynthesis C-methylase UbiE